MQTVPYVFHNISGFKKCKLALGHTFIDLSLAQRYLYWNVFQNFAPALQATPLCCSTELHFGAWMECFKRQGKCRELKDPSILSANKLQLALHVKDAKRESPL